MTTERVAGWLWDVYPALLAFLVLVKIGADAVVLLSIDCDPTVLDVGGRQCVYRSCLPNDQQLTCFPEAP